MQCGIYMGLTVMPSHCQLNKHLSSHQCSWACNMLWMMTIPCLGPDQKIIRFGYGLHDLFGIPTHPNSSQQIWYISWFGSTQHHNFTTPDQRPAGTKKHSRLLNCVNLSWCSWMTTPDHWLCFQTRSRWRGSSISLITCLVLFSHRCHSPSAKMFLFNCLFRLRALMRDPKPVSSNIVRVVSEFPLYILWIWKKHILKIYITFMTWDCNDQACEKGLW